eukprot:6808399-Pyramimonas_sp.AAC.1
MAQGRSDGTTAGIPARTASERCFSSWSTRSSGATSGRAPSASDGRPCRGAVARRRWTEQGGTHGGPRHSSDVLLEGLS